MMFLNSISVTDDHCTVRKIETIRYLINEFIILNIYIFNLINEKIKMIEIIMKVHLVCNLKIKLLIDINVLDSEEMNISFCNSSLIINSKDEWKTSIHIHAKNNTHVCQKIQALKKQIILSHSLLIISIKFKSVLSTDQDFLFTSIYPGAYTHLIDINMQFIHVWNDSDQPIHIFSKNDLEKIIKMKEEQCYYVDNDSHDLTVWKSVKDDESNMLKSNKTNQVSIDLFVMSDMINDTDESIFQQNSEILSDIINENVSISFRIQIH